MFILLTWISSFAMAATNTTTYSAVSESDFSSESNHWAGLAFGPNFTSVSHKMPEGELGPKTSMRTRMFVGAQYQFVLHEYFAAESGLYYSEKGYGFKRGEALIPVAINANYLDLPVLAKIRLPRERFAPYMVVGPTLGVLVGTRSVQLVDEEEQESSLTGAFNTFNAALTFGPGVDISLANQVLLGLSLRYNLGLTNQIANSDIKVEQKHNNFQALVGASFEL